MSENLYGWIPNPQAVADFRAELAAEGNAFCAVGVGDSLPLKGFWKRLVSRGVTGVFLQDAEEQLFGKSRPSFTQARGTCVDRSGSRALQDTIYGKIVRGEIAKGVEIAGEVSYGISRVNVTGQRQNACAWGCRSNHGHGDGTWGGSFYKGLHDFGCVVRDSYGTIDLTQRREDLAIQWGNEGVPAALLTVAANHKASACHHAESLEDLADMVAAGYASQICCGWIRGLPNRSGISKSSDRGGHATEIAGVCLSEKGETLYVEQQSWGDSYGSNVILRYAGGEKRLRQGSFGVTAADIWNCVSDSGEAWAADIPANLPRPATLEEYL